MAEIIIVHGAPGSGKTTLCRRYVEECAPKKVEHVSIGERVREIRTGFRVSRFCDELIKPKMDETVKHPVVTGVLFESISMVPAGSLVLVDGFPSYPEAFECFMNRVLEEKHTLLGGLNLSVSPDVSFGRISGRGSRSGERLGLNYENVNRRYVRYVNSTIPTLRLLENYVPVSTINTEGGINKSWDEFNKSLNNLTGQSVVRK